MTTQPIQSTTDDLIAEIELDFQSARKLGREAYIDMQDGEALIDRIRELEQAQRWVPVTERMPEVGVHVLACKVGRKTNHGPFFAMACKNEMMPWRYIDGDRCDVKVSHWQPLPELPQ